MNKIILKLRLRFLLLTFIYLYIFINLFGQSANIGNPPCVNFKKSQYKGGTQTWEIAESKNGIVWFANNYGLLEYNGSTWNSYKILNSTIIRSVQISEQDDRIYVGGQGDFGYFEPNKTGVLKYFSLKELLQPNEQNFGDIWDIIIKENSVYFRSDNQIFCYDKSKISKIINKPIHIIYFGKLNNQLVFQSDNFDLYKIEGNLPIRFENTSINGGQIASIFQLTKDTSLIFTYKKGIFSYCNNKINLWQTTNDDFLIKNIIFSAVALPSKKIAIGTVLNGIVILDENRRIIQHINKKNGLQNNTILSLFCTSSNMLWAGTDNGIDLIKFNSPFSTFYPDGDLQGTGYTIGVDQGKIYFGTNTGLYFTDWKNYYSPLNLNKFSIVKNSEGQVWSLNKIDDKLLMGHHEGAFQIKNNEAIKLSDIKGIWNFVSISPSKILVGHYNGLALFESKANSLTFKSVLNGLDESCRILKKENSLNFWMAHPYHGLFNLSIDTIQNSVKSKLCNGKNGLPNSLNNNIFKLNNKLIFSTNNALFSYDQKLDSFIFNQNFQNYFSQDDMIKYMYQDKYDNIWFVSNKEIGCLKVDNQPFEKKITKQLFPELNDKLTEGFQFILPIDSQNIFFATEKGFVNFDHSRYEQRNKILRVLFNNVMLKGEKDSVLFDGHLDNPYIPIELSYFQNVIKISYSSPDYPENELIQYAHFLEGADSKWSEWSQESNILLSNLPFGKYKFLLKAKNQYGEISDLKQITFIINAPWYRTNIAYFFYFISVIFGIFIMLRSQQLKHKSEKKSIVLQHQEREAEHLKNASLTEENLNKLQNDYLEAEIRHKNQELVSATMHITQKNEMMNNIRLALNKLNQKSDKSTEFHQEIENIIKMVQQDAKIDSDWDNFIQNFDNIHNDFFRRLKEKHPHLSSNEYKLCAYLRMNLTSKDISKLMNISTRSVETNRYRLRKKLDLSNDINLNDYFNNF